MRFAFACALAGSLAAAALMSPARADIGVGAVAPPFTKSELAGGPGAWSAGGPVSLGDHAGQVVVLFLLGYG
ncbi:MAG TPA: hypothetical protein VGK89_02340 [Candidatus Eisenbacteria bacterium]|jgi:hypothetical protein